MSDEHPDQPITPDGVVQGAGLPADGVGPTPPGDLDGLGALLGADGGIDFGSLMEQATNLQSQMLAAQEELLAAEVEGVAGGGAVRVAVTGGYEFRKVTIDPSAVDPSDVEMLEDLVLAALNDAGQRIAEIQSGSMPGGLGLGDLFGA